MFLFSMSVHASRKMDVFISHSDDGYIYGPLVSNYTEAHDNATGTVDDYTHIAYLGQVYEFENYLIHRAFLFFDTEIPQKTTITSVSLRIYIYQDESDTDFNITIQTGESFPHKPLQSNDYNHSLYSGNGGSLDSSNVIIGYNDINILSDSWSWINKSGITKLCLRSDNDISETPPTELERIRFYTSEGDYPPLLNVFYEEGPPSSGGDTGNGEPTSPIEIPEITVPKIPIWGYYLILGSVCVVALASILTKRPKSKHGPNGTKIKTTHKRYPKRNKKGRFT